MPFKTAIVVSLSPTSFEALALSGDVAGSFEAVSRHGFSAVEIAVRDPALVKSQKITETADRFGLAVAAIGTGQAWVEEGLSLTDPDPGARRKALLRIKSQIDLGMALGARPIIGLIRGTAGKGRESESLKLLADSLVELGEYARVNSAPGLLVEPINRYETRLLNSVPETVEFLAGLPDLPLAILADTFHMNIEDKKLDDSLKLAGSRLGHVHFADSNRWAPGQGHLDFGAVFDGLRQIGYDGYLSAEILPLPTPADSMAMTAEFFGRWNKGLEF